MAELSKKPIIAVTGATGMQGGSVAQRLLEDGSFKVRALTRKVDSDKAKGSSFLLHRANEAAHSRILELKAKGAEVVFADYENYESLVAAFQGAYVVFGVTNCETTSLLFLSKIHP